MRKLFIAAAALAALGIAIPASTDAAQARDVVVVHKVKVHHDRGRHLGWYKHHRHDVGRAHRRHVVVVR